ncbi:hypothetical protein A500_04581 [Clostridium sartagoforme AAU1]|uniref:Uncharacterized protein n=1 Tax=Clostridium sartagoforme AAU1 TaxID=1202534 RepID=R9CDG7_9CLOT|nr:hypothetical protein [Clostridium sartagoforme]EOR27389.1 hypothetical protein A500_04581 [Clostridium sartagoforme AAU1]
MNFKNWVVAKEKAEEFNLYTKAYLKEKYNRKPTKDAKEEICKVYTGGRWREFSFYRMEDTIEIKTRNTKELIELDINDENIFKSLYVINKSAKKSRDTKNKNYYLKNYKMVNMCKNRQINLYDLKDLVIKKAIEENRLKLEGFHVQKIGDNFNYLNLYKGNQYMFHVPENESKGKYLGELGIITSEIRVNTKIKFEQAIDLLERYINKKFD